MIENELSGVLCLDKNAGATSHDMVNAVRRLYGTKKVGHTGTLDPMATGVLVILIGRAAKAAEYLTAGTKKYQATLKLGIETDTEDTTGKILRTCCDIPSSDDVVSAAKEFSGKIKQIPPMYSALKVNGRKLVNLARRGIEVERDAREIEIFLLEAVPLSEKDGEYSLTVECSAGTYIRTLCADIGKKLGCGAAMSSLRRLASGNFKVEDSTRIETLKDMTLDERSSLLLPTEALFANCPQVDLPDFFASLAYSGCEIYQEKIGTSFPDGTRVRFCNKNGFFALGEVKQFEEGSAIKPIKLFVLQRKAE